MSGAAHIRDAMLADASACAAILNDWIDATEWMPRIHTHAVVENHFRDVVFRDRDVWVSEMTQITGFAAIDRDEAYVTALYVAAPERRQGVGAQLMTYVKAQNPDGLSLRTFQANEDAIRFYRRNGFAETDRSDGDNEENLPDILFRWDGVQ